MMRNNEILQPLKGRRLRSALLNLPNSFKNKHISALFFFLFLCIAIFLLVRFEEFSPATAATTRPAIGESLLENSQPPARQLFQENETTKEIIRQPEKIDQTTKEPIAAISSSEPSIPANTACPPSIPPLPENPQMKPSELLELHRAYFAARRLYFSDQRDLMKNLNSGENSFWYRHSLGEILANNQTETPILWPMERFQAWKEASTKAEEAYGKRRVEYRRLRAKMAEIHGVDWEVEEGPEEETRPSNIFDIQVMVVTGRRTLRSRLENFMHTVGKEIPSGHIWFVSDVLGDSDPNEPYQEKKINRVYEEVFPLLSILGREANYVESQGKWIPGLEFLMDRGMEGEKARWYLILDDDSLFFPANYIHFINTGLRKQNWAVQPAYYGRLCSLEDSHTDVHQRFCGGGGWSFNQAMAEKIHHQLRHSCIDYNILGQASHYLSACFQKEFHIPLTPAIEFNTHPLSYYLTFSPGGLMDFPRGNGKMVTVHYLSLDYQEIQLKSDRQKWLHYYQFYAAFTRNEEEESDRETTY